MIFSNVVGDLKNDAHVEIILPCSRCDVGSSQTLCGIVKEEFISRPTTVIELDLQLCLAVNVSLLAQWQSYLILDMLKDVFLKSTNPSLLRRGLKLGI